MTETEHTPGPWGIFHIPDGRPHMIQSKVNGVGIGTVFTHNENLYANADVLAAAPEMLEALKNALSILKTFHDTSGVIQQIEAVISKAQGGRINMMKPDIDET